MGLTKRLAAPIIVASLIPTMLTAEGLERAAEGAEWGGELEDFGPNLLQILQLRNDIVPPYYFCTSIGDHFIGNFY